MNKMSKWCRVLPLAMLFAFLLGLPAAAQAPMPASIPNGLPSWAYNIPDKDQPPPARVTGTIRVPGSAKEYDAAQVRSTTNPPDWFPDEHPPAPNIVKGPNAPPGATCGTCHLMSGQAHPESPDPPRLPPPPTLPHIKHFNSA